MRRIAVVFALAVLTCGLLAACTSSGTAKHSGSASASSGPSSATGSTAAVASGTSSGTASSTASASSSAGSGGSSRVGPSGGPVPKGFTPTSVTFASSSEAWVLGTAPCSSSPCTSIVRTTDDGRTWAGIPAPRTTLGQPDSGRNGGVAVIRFADQRDGWAGVGELWSTHDGGAHWTKQKLPGENGVVSAIESGGGYVFAATDGCPSQGGNHCSNTAQLYVSPVGQDNWARVASITAPGGGSQLVVQGSSWYLSVSPGIHHGNGVKTSPVLANPCPSEGGDGRPSAHLAVASSRFLDAVCVGQGAAGSARYQLYGSSDGGAHWKKAGPSRIERSNLTGVADNTKGVLLLAAASGNSAILRTTDDGTTLHTAFSVSNGGIEWADLGFTTPTQAVVILANSGLYLSHDAGASFSRVRF